MLVVGVGCTRGTSGSSGTRVTLPAAEPGEHQHSNPLAVTMAGKASPEQLRERFEQLLGLHTLIAVRLMRSVVMKAPDLQQAATISLQQDTDALSQLVATAYGRAEGDRFKQLWQGHVSNLLSYANAVASHDEPARQDARSELISYGNSLGAWFSAASRGRVAASDAAGAVRVHVQDLMRQLDAYAAKDYEQAYAIEREGYEHMFSAGATLARGSLTPELALGFDAAPQRLKSAFAMLLGEHLELIVEAQRATFAGSPEFRAAAAQVNANTAALASAMGAIVGPRRAAEFQSAWADHVEGLMAYTAAVAGEDRTGRDSAEKRLNSFAVSLAAYFAGVVNDPHRVVPLTGALTSHDRHLFDQVQAYAAKDYPRAQELEIMGYQQMIGVASTLVAAIQRTLQPRLPVGGPRTGGGGLACRLR